MTKRWNFVLLLFFGAFGCSAPVEPTVGENEARAVRDGVEFTLRLEKVQLRLSDTLKGTFEVWNRTNSERAFEFLNQQQLGFEIQRPNGETVQQWPILFQPAASRFVLQPNQRRTLVLQALLIDWRTGHPLPTGRFWLSAYLLDDNSPRVRLGIEIRE
ncbi:MAG: hypothetical protein RMI34_03000 [Chloroherpetonaceae bacterium]|nr:hypothetical protein [Chloroherpetonaceae bacterium]MCS7212533.1 hypothetical protein [Chloroherpetonaceae bacterium]MDW8019025.1 hypothetical protein [Chloroherpetonaceae bacterium]MDW8466118.1 hypothetical protein [Chloroherpetonaceae bacterium]